MKFNLKDNSEKAELHPEGAWDATIISAVAQASRAGDPQIVLTWKTSVGKIKGWMTMHPKAIWRVRLDLKALGFTEEYLDNEENDLDDLAVELVKRRAMIEVIHRDGEKGVLAGVEAINPIPDSGIKPSA